MRPRPPLSAMLLLLAAGCAGDPPITTIPETSTERRWEVNPPSAWKRIEVAGRSGYLQQERRIVDGQELVTWWVYDDNMRELGFYTEGGSTYRFGLRGDPVAMGRHDRDESIRLIFDPNSVGLQTQVGYFPLEGGRPRAEDGEEAASD